jgi:hypothetical protein
MTAATVTDDQRTAAKVAGGIYLVAMAMSMFAELYLRGPLIVRGDAVQTAINIVGAERLFRISSVIHLLTFASDAAIAVALYVVLKPVNRNLALLAAFWRLADCAMLAANVVNDFAALRLISGADSLRSFDAAQLQGLMRLFLSISAAGFQIGFVLLGLGSTLFSYLWLRSRYIPRVVAAWGIFASLTLAVVTLAVMVFPGLGARLGLMYMAPMFLYEVGLGGWLLVKGLPMTAQRANL